ncbi:hypothetical protein EMPS_03824 [Entomortierella parvispora]|uniref:Arm-like repeat domain-containing protein n=1 Tax=Entomortierella parvispora TaxID=205924 RepID=A0A9P3H7B2_9FUNG|nr:hypothetical protein EMPS_03824 [Entomortierella parvispora]
MSKSPQKSHAKDGSASGAKGKSRIAAAIFGMSKMSFSVAVSKAGKGSKSAPTTAPIVSKAIRNSTPVSVAASTPAPSPSPDAPFNSKSSTVAVPNTMTAVLDIFSMDTTKIKLVIPLPKSDAIREIVLLGPVLDKELYRALLNQFLYELANKDILSVDLLQGLVKLVEHAPPFYLLADLPIKILRAIRHHFKDSSQQETSTIIHLTIAISKVLVIMADGGAEDLNRAEEHEPLLEILSKLKKHTDPLM